MKRGRLNLLLLLAAAAIAAAPLVISLDGDAVFSGADGLAQTEAQRIRPDYRPWATAFWQPPSAEVESLLFSLQAAIGAGLFGYYIGRRRGEAKGESPPPTQGPRASGAGR